MNLTKFLAGCALTLSLVLVTSAVVAQDSDTTMPPSDLTNPQAAFIYSHDFAISKGATAEWRKMEGVAFDTVNSNFYVAVTAVQKGMSDDKGDIQMTDNPCGAVFGGSLDASYDLAALKQVVVGGPYDESNADYPCSADSISSPDNIFADSKGNLWIGEDTDFHHNQMLWMWDGKELKRFATMPEGAEVTGLRVEPDGTIFLNVQHPNATNIYPFNRATVGVITGFQAGDDFTAVPVPTGDDMKQLKIAAGQYEVLARTGESIPADTERAFFGEIPAADGSVLNTCNNPDGNMFLPTDSAGTQGYLYSNWECSPGGVSKLYIQQDTDGTWSSVEGSLVDFTDVNGTRNNCNASVTPWNTALTSEEYPGDVQGEYDGYYQEAPMIAQNIGHDANTLDYGYIVELTPAGGEEDGIGTVVTKHYTMGRFSHEMALVMPDSKTAYFGDDGTDRILYKFVADTAGDLSAGTLYAAKTTQDGEALNLNWIELGHSNDADIEAAIRATDVQTS
jgi:secreted PhoX family phosphatase